VPFFTAKMFWYGYIPLAGFEHATSSNSGALSIKLKAFHMSVCLSCCKPAGFAYWVPNIKHSSSTYSKFVIASSYLLLFALQSELKVKVCKYIKKLEIFY